MSLKLYYQTPIFNLDTTKLTDGEHQLRIINKFGNKEGSLCVSMSATLQFYI
ncbi:hypothetical protein [Chryseobacterium flavum]|uniref:hypothetical protein n=1 Tax=Chryseobacterium flavum TaxID=415851 RepID=UPI002FD97937